MISSAGRVSPARIAATHRASREGRFMVDTATVTQAVRLRSGNAISSAEQRLGIPGENADISDLEVVATISGSQTGQSGPPSRLFERLLEKRVHEQEREQRWQNLEASHVLRNFGMNRSNERTRWRCGAKEHLEVIETRGIRVAGVNGSGPVRDERQQVRKRRPPPCRLPVNHGDIAAVEIHV